MFSCCDSLPFARLRGLALCLTRGTFPVLQQANIFLYPQLSLYIRISVIRLPFSHIGGIVRACLLHFHLVKFYCLFEDRARFTSHTMTHAEDETQYIVDICHHGPCLCLTGEICRPLEMLQSTDIADTASSDNQPDSPRPEEASSGSTTVDPSSTPSATHENQVLDFFKPAMSSGFLFTLFRTSLRQDIGFSSSAPKHVRCCQTSNSLFAPYTTGLTASQEFVSRVLPTATNHTSIL